MINNITIKTFLSIALLCTAITTNAQTYSTLWTKNEQAIGIGTQTLHPTKHQTYYTNEASLLKTLQKTGASYEQAATIELPTPNGSFQAFKVWKTPIMAKELAAKYPDILTFTAEALDNKNITAKIDYTQFGLHAYFFNGDNTYLIDPLTNIADGNYMVYYKKDYPRTIETSIPCTVVKGDEETTETVNTGNDNHTANRINGTTIRKYRLALACTGEYAVAVAGASPTKAAVLAKMVTTMNRVNGVYERELAYTLELIGNVDTLIYLDGTTDPYSNNSSTSLLSENQSSVTSTIGSANYDIGHVFSTGGGGIAALGCVCKSNFKARGVTGRANPVGDAFDIDYVAHEMGHQFGAEHTFNNNTTGSCSTNAEVLTAYEPGSGSTIMAYAGICGAANDYQSNSSDNFHAISLQQITIFISNNSCAVTSTSPNSNATMSSYTATYSIPYSTPFELIAPTATDATADALTYSWEQWNLGDFGKTIAATRLAGPTFRPFPPTTSPTRVFPILDSVLKNTFSYKGEKLADTSRILTFRLTQRDVFQGYGCFNFPDDSIRINVIYTGTPFKVTSPTTNSTWAANSTQTVTWNVGSTTAAPINCSQVDIYISIDSGYTFPYTLVQGTANDGSETITVPNVNTSKMRIKVKASGNVFFSINSAPTSSVPTTNIDDGIRVAPVPTNNMVTISVKNGKTYYAQVFNTIGQIIWTGDTSNQQNIDVRSWADGNYILELNDKTSGSKFVKRLVKQ